MVFCHPGYLVCVTTGHVVMGAQVRVFGCPQVPDYLVCMTTGHAVMGTRLWVGGSRSYCHRFMVSSWLL